MSNTFKLRLTHYAKEANFSRGETPLRLLDRCWWKGVKTGLYIGRTTMVHYFRIFKTPWQACDEGGRREASTPLEKFFPFLEKCAGAIDVKYILSMYNPGHLRKLFLAPWCPKLVTGRSPGKIINFRNVVIFCEFISSQLCFCPLASGFPGCRPMPINRG